MKELTLVVSSFVLSSLPKLPCLISTLNIYCLAGCRVGSIISVFLDEKVEAKVSHRVSSGARM